MKKVTNISLAGSVFTIEDDAYEKLKQYLGAIEMHYATVPDGAEVLADIEQGLAEKLRVRLGKMSVVTLLVVDEVTKEMGQIEDIVGEEAEETVSSDKANQAESAESDAASTVRRRLFRDTDTAILGGVAGGIANYFSIDPVIVRLLFVASVLFNGFGILLYLVLWLIVPAAKTTSEKYQMRGEAVTIAKIAERTKEGIENVRSSITSDGVQTNWQRIRGILIKLFDIFGLVFRFVFKVLRYVVGFGLVLIGALGIAGLVSVYSVVLFSDSTLLPLEANMALDIMLGSTSGIIAITSSFVATLIPLLLMITGGASLLTRRNLFTVPKSIIMGVIWVVAIGLAGTTSALQVEKVMQVSGFSGRWVNDEFELEGRWEQGHFKIDTRRVVTGTTTEGWPIELATSSESVNE